MNSLLFVYNANSGKLNTLFDIGHKLISPSTYRCHLCELTHDTFSENNIWREFRDHSNIAMEFYHKDEFESVFPTFKTDYPVILKKTRNVLHPLLDTKAIDAYENVNDLITYIKELSF